MNEAGLEFGPLTPYGSKLIQCGHSHQKLGLIHREFIQSAVIVYIQPLRSYLEGEMKSICVKICLKLKKRKRTFSSFQKERRTLEMKRLDLDALRSKQKKNRTNNERENEQQIRQAQGEFDRQIHLTRLMLESLHPTQV